MKIFYKIFFLKYDTIYKEVSGLKKEIRTLVFDDELNIETYRFEGIVRAFPDHFHDYYVIGLVEAGERRLVCNNRTFELSGGDLLLLDPGDSHGCVQTDGGTLDYRALNIGKDKMSELALEITGERYLPRFSENVLRGSGLSDCYRKLHEMILSGFVGFGKEEALLILISELIKLSGKPFFEQISRHAAPIERVCRFIDERYSEHITLEQLCKCSGLSKSTLLRSFTKARGVTPYRYLQAVRINKAKELLEQGAKPIDAALSAGFSDQSHFTNFFGTFIGLPPGAYSRIFREQEDKE